MLLGTLVLLLLVIDSGVITGLLRGGHLHGLRGARLKALPLLVAALMLQLLLGLAWFQVPGGRWGFGSVLLLVSLVLLVVVVVVRANRPVLGARVGVFGIQPVVSVGDVLRYLGLFLLIQALMVRNAGRRPKQRRRPAAHGRRCCVAWLAIRSDSCCSWPCCWSRPGSERPSTPDRSWRRPSRPCRGRCWSVSASPSAGGRQGPGAAGGRHRVASRPAGVDGRQHRPKGRRRGREAAGAPAGPAPLWVLAIKATNTPVWAWRWNGSAGGPGKCPRAPGGRADGRRRLWWGVPDGGRPVGPHPLSTSSLVTEASMSCCSRSAVRWWSSSPRSSEPTSSRLPPRIGP